MPVYHALKATRPRRRDRFVALPIRTTYCGLSSLDTHFMLSHERAPVNCKRCLRAMENQKHDQQQANVS